MISNEIKQDQVEKCRCAARFVGFGIISKPNRESRLQVLPSHPPHAGLFLKRCQCVTSISVFGTIPDQMHLIVCLSIDAVLDEYHSPLDLKLHRQYCQERSFSYAVSANITHSKVCSVASFRYDCINLINEYSVVCS